MNSWGVTFMIQKCLHTCKALCAFRHTLLSGLPDFLLFVLQLVELEVDSAQGKQLLMRTHFPDFAFVHHDDLVGVLNRRKPVGDHDRSSSAQQLFNRLLNQMLGLCVNA